MEEGLRVIKGVLLGCTKTAGESRSVAGFTSARIKGSLLIFHIGKQRPTCTHPSDNFSLLVHADVMIALFSFYSDVAPECFRLHDEESWKGKGKTRVIFFFSFQHAWLNLVGSFQNFKVCDAKYFKYQSIR